MLSIKDEYEIQPIPYKVAMDLFVRNHYLHRKAPCSQAFGLFEKEGNNGRLVGVVVYGTPASRALQKGLCGEEEANNVLELTRLWIEDGTPKNTESFLIGNTMSLVKKEILVSYAEVEQGHLGIVYQATNWIYTGLSAKRTERYDINNPNRHSKSVTEQKGVNYKDLAIRERPQKHRYIYFTGNKKQVIKLKKELNYKIEPYPKGINKRYDSSYKPTIQKELF